MAAIPRAAARRPVLVAGGAPFVALSTLPYLYLYRVMWTGYLYSILLAAVDHDELDVPSCDRSTKTSTTHGLFRATIPD